MADRLVRDVGGSPLVGTNFFAQLYWSTGTANVGSDQPFGIAVTNPPVRFRAATTTAPGTWIASGGSPPGTRVLGFAEAKTVRCKSEHGISTRVQPLKKRWPTAGSGEFRLVSYIGLQQYSSTHAITAWTTFEDLP